MRINQEIDVQEVRLIGVNAEQIGIEIGRAHV